MTDKLIISLLVILAASWGLGLIFIRFGLPVMLGELMAGLILGPAILNVVHMNDQLEFLAELGIFFAMFYAGMEMDPKKLLESIWPSLVVALGGFFLPFILGFLVCKLFGGTLYQSLFVGMGLSVTAIAVQAVILQGLQIHHTRVGHIIMGAAIADDILSLITLSVLLGLAKSGSIELSSLVLILLKVVVFFAFTIFVGEFVLPRFTRRLHDDGGKAFTFAMLAALVMAYLAELAGLHLVIGAFLAGQFVRRDIMDGEIYRKISDRFFALSYGFLTPIFFATLAFHLRFDWSLIFIAFAVTITLVAILGKLLGCGLGALLMGFSQNEAKVIGLGMNGRGAVELVVAAVVIKLSNELMGSGIISEPLLTDMQFSGLVFMAFVTTLLTPILLKRSVLASCNKNEQESFCVLWDNSQER